MGLTYVLTAAVISALFAASAPTLNADSAYTGSPAARSSVAAALQKCSRKTATAVIPRSTFGRSIKKKLRRYVEVGAGPILGYGIDDLICRDVTRDGRAEMIVLLTCCTAKTPTPWAIFTRRAQAWRSAFRVVSRKITVSRLRVNQQGDIVERRPRYDADDPLCCPSSFTRRLTHWDGKQFVVRTIP